MLQYRSTFAIVALSLISSGKAQLQMCNGASYSPNMYSCIQQGGQSTLCPIVNNVALQACGTACYDPNTYTCNNGVLTLNSGGSPAPSSGTSPYPMTLPIVPACPQAMPPQPNANPSTVTVTTTINGGSTYTATTTTTATATGTGILTNSTGNIPLYCLPRDVASGNKMAFSNLGYMQIQNTSNNAVLGYAGMLDFQMRLIQDSIDIFAYYPDDNSISVYGHDYGVGVGKAVTAADGSMMNILYFGATGCNGTWTYDPVAGFSFKGYSFAAGTSDKFVYLYKGSLPANTENIRMLLTPAPFPTNPQRNDEEDDVSTEKQLFSAGWD